MEFHFTGDNLTQNQYEVLALGIDPTMRTGESDLYRSRWFDYADMHPSKATYLFAHLYALQVKKFYETCIDARRASEPLASAPIDVFTSKHATSFWNARRVCDAIGCPYDFALDLAQRRAIDRAMRVLPRPNQLCSEDFEIDLKDAWKEVVTRSLRYSSHKRFRMENYTGTWVQRRHVESLLGQVKSRPVESHRGLLGRLISERTLGESVLDGHFSAALIKSAKNRAAEINQ